MCLIGFQDQKFTSKCHNDINTEWAITEKKKLGFLLYPGKFQTKQDVRNFKA